MRHVLFTLKSRNGRPMQKQSLYVRIKQLVKRARIKKKLGTHTLRHSIANAPVAKRDEVIKDTGVPWSQFPFTSVSSGSVQ